MVKGNQVAGTHTLSIEEEEKEEEQKKEEEHPVFHLITVTKQFINIKGRECFRLIHT